MLNKRAFICAALAASLLLVSHSPVRADQVAPPQGTATTTMNTGLSASLRADPRYRLGEPITLDFELRNTSAQDYAVLTWDTPLEGKALDYLTVRRGDRELPYEGPVFKRGKPGVSSYRTVPAGGTISGTVDLTTAFTEPGTYTATIDTRLRDAAPAAEVSRGRTDVEFAEHRLGQVTVTFDVLPGGAARLTDAEVARRSSTSTQDRTSIEAAAKPDLQAIPADKRETVLKAHHKGYDYTRNAIRGLPKPLTAGKLLHYVEWFGAYDVTRHDKVRGSYETIDRYLADRVITYYPTGPICEDDEFACVLSDVPQKIWLCSGFWDTNPTGIDSQAGVVVHEVSHLAVGTRDHTYQPDGARELAKRNPGLAVTNADNYEYFAETTS